MANRNLIRVAVIFFAFFALVAAQGRKPRPRQRTNSPDAFYDCFNQQVCNCGKHSRWEDCWDEASEGSRNFLVDEFNKCGMNVTLEYGRLEEWSSLMCSVPEDIRKACALKANDNVKERTKNTALGLLGYEETIAQEKARKCLEPNIAFCSNFPSDCMSEG